MSAMVAGEPLASKKLISESSSWSSATSTRTSSPSSRAITTTSSPSSLVKTTLTSSSPSLCSADHPSSEETAADTTAPSSTYKSTDPAWPAAIRKSPRTSSAGPSGWVATWTVCSLSPSGTRSTTPVAWAPPATLTRAAAPTRSLPPVVAAAVASDANILGFLC